MARSIDKIIGIEVIVKCEDCDGTGVVYDPLGFGWEDLNKLGNDDYEAAVRERGYEPTSRRLPPEEGECIECDGAGELRRRLSPAEFMEVLELERTPLT